MKIKKYLFKVDTTGWSISVFVGVLVLHIFSSVFNPYF